MRWPLGRASPTGGVVVVVGGAARGDRGAELSRSARKLSAKECELRNEGGEGGATLLLSPGLAAGLDTEARADMAVPARTPAGRKFALTCLAPGSTPALSQMGSQRLGVWD